MNYFGKKAYVSKEVADTYDEERFTSAQGKYINEIDMDAVRHFMARVNKPGLLLDLACGSGRFAELALNLHNRVVAVDISLELLKVTKDKLKNHNGLAGLILCDAERLPFKNNAFGCVTAMRFTGLLPRAVLRDLLTEINRVTQKWAIVDFANILSANLILAMARNFQKHSPELYYVSSRALRNELESAGFEIMRQRTPRIIPPGRIPKRLLPIVKAINWLGLHSFLGYFSEQYILLLRKKNGQTARVE